MGESCVTILLMYQYVEPPWTKNEHGKSLKRVISLAEKYNITGRGRCAAEGLNCTLTGDADNVQAFCQSLREWKPEIFNKTDFKLTHGCKSDIRFKSLSLRKVDELVKYKMDGVKAPSIQQHGGEHVEAKEFHNLMEQSNAIIVDVRNFYETAIGRFTPPTDGAEYVDPKMRTSSDFPKWLQMDETKKKLQGKDVLMYCTGGIRCERATALLNQFSQVEDDFQINSLKMVQGGIERYMRSFPDGGYWRGLNYLFDKRQLQAPENKSIKIAEMEAIKAAEQEGWNCLCSLCEKPWAKYRGQYKCIDCNVPVIVCTSCIARARKQIGRLRCRLCLKGYDAPKISPDFIGQKRKLGLLENNRDTKMKSNPCEAKCKRLFVGKLPLIVNANTLKLLLGEGVDFVHWIGDRQNGAFYGSAFVQMETAQFARSVVERAASNDGIIMEKKRLKITIAPVKDEVWPPEDFEESQFPPLGVFTTS